MARVKTQNLLICVVQALQQMEAGYCVGFEPGMKIVSPTFTSACSAAPSFSFDCRLHLSPALFVTQQLPSGTFGGAGFLCPIDSTCPVAVTKTMSSGMRSALHPEGYGGCSLGKTNSMP